MIFRKAKINDTDKIYNTLSKSFEPYKKYFTKKGYNSAVLSSDEIQERIKKNIFKVYVVTIDNKIVGTTSIIQKNDRYYIRSLAVEPDYQNKGIGLFILENIFKIAKKENIKKISLDSFKPLNKAVNFYEKHGFKKTGITKDLYGNEIFEMLKESV